MNIAFCFDNNYTLGYLVTLVSLFENNKNGRIRVYIITPGLSEENKAKFSKLGEIYHQEIIFCKMDVSRFEMLHTTLHFNHATYYRYMIPELCPESKILQLDGDIIVRKDLQALWKTDVSTVPCAVVEDQMCDDIIINNRVRVKHRYFNNGVQLMNLDYWREHHLADQCIAFLREHPEKCFYLDQDANNCVFGDKVAYLPYTYNFQEGWYADRASWGIHYSKWPEIEAAKADPAIVHFCTSLKPWVYECTHPLQGEFLHYATLHPFIGFHMKYAIPFKMRLKHRLFQLAKFVFGSKKS